MRIGTITVQNGNNYGASLQAFALVKYLRKNGWDAYLIDYRNKRVLKGGEVMDLKELLVEPNKQAKVEHCNSIINLLLKDGTKYTMDSFKKLMLDYGYRFSMNGTIFINGDDKALLVLDKYR